MRNLGEPNASKRRFVKPRTCPWCGTRLRTFSPDGFESKRCRVESRNHDSLLARIRAMAAS